MAHCWVPPWEGTTLSNLSPMAYITKVYGCLISLKLLLINTWTSIETTVQVWSAFIQVYAASLWGHGHYKYTAILQGRERRYGKLTILCLFILQVMSAKGSYSKGAGENLPTEVPQVSTVVQVATAAPSVSYNIFTGTLQGNFAFTITQVRVLVDDVYDSQEYLLYWKFINIKEWWQLKAKIPVSRGGVSYGDRKIKCLQALAWWVRYLRLQGKIININSFNTDILADTIEES